MSDDNEKNQDSEMLYIPVNVRRRKETIEGFGKEEIIKTIIWAGIGLFVGIIIFLLFFREIFTIILSTIVFPFGCFVMVRKDKTNRSTIDLIKVDIRFRRSQKRYKYKYNNPLAPKEVIKTDEGD